jgi:hypothetical protein
MELFAIISRVSVKVHARLLCLGCRVALSPAYAYPRILNGGKIAIRGKAVYSATNPSLRYSASIACCKNGRNVRKR